MTIQSVPHVDLLDCTREPTDAELEALTKSMMTAVRARARTAYRALMSDLRSEVVAARMRADGRVVHSETVPGG